MGLLVEGCWPRAGPGGRHGNAVLMASEEAHLSDRGSACDPASDPAALAGTDRGPTEAGAGPVVFPGTSRGVIPLLRRAIHRDSRGSPFRRGPPRDCPRRSRGPAHLRGASDRLGSAMPFARTAGTDSTAFGSPVKRSAPNTPYGPFFARTIAAGDRSRCPRGHPCCMKRAGLPIRTIYCLSIDGLHPVGRLPAARYGGAVPIPAISAPGAKLVSPVGFGALLKNALWWLWGRPRARRGSPEPAFAGGVMSYASPSTQALAARADCSAEPVTGEPCRDGGHGDGALLERTG